MIILDSPVITRTEWSPWNIVSKVIAGELTVAGDDVLISMAVIYLLIPFALMAVYRPGPPKVLILISTIGLAMDGALWRGSRSIPKFGFPWGMDTFGFRHMRVGLALWILFSIMPALFALCYATDLDSERPLRENI